MKFRTRGPHYLPGDRYVDANVEIGDETAFPLPDDFVPSRNMEPLDEEASELFNQLEQRDDPMSEVAIRRQMVPLNAEIQRLQQENANLRAAFNAAGQSGTEPFTPETSTGPSQTPENINKKPFMAGVPTADVSRPPSGSGGGQMPRDERTGKTFDPVTGEEVPPGMEAPPGSSSTTPPRETIGSEAPGNEPPRPRRALDELINKQRAPTEPSGGPTEPKKSGMEMPKPQEDKGEGPSSKARPGDQPVEDPTKNLPPNVAGEGMDMTDPGPGPGPGGKKATADRASKR